MPDMYTAVLSGAGLLIIIAGKATLGRSFGLMPAHRGLVSTVSTAGCGTRSTPGTSWRTSPS